MTYYQEINQQNPSQTDSTETPPVNIQNQPKLIISSYSISPKNVIAGEDIAITLNFYNTNNKNTIYNLKISVDSEGSASPAPTSGENTPTVSDSSAFSPVESSNTFYVQALYPWNYATRYANLRVNPNAAAGNYTLTVNMDYEDYQGNQYQTKQTIGVNVGQRAGVTIGDVKHDELMVGQETGVSVNIYNTGKDNLNTFMCDVIGKGFTIDNDRRFIGNFNTGSTETFSFNITPEREGPVQGKILLTYEDSQGKVHTQVEDFAAEVTAGFNDMEGAEGMDGMTVDPETGELIPMDPSMEDGQGGGGLLTSPFIWLGLIIILVLAGLLIRNSRKKKKNEELIIEDEDI